MDLANPEGVDQLGFPGSMNVANLLQTVVVQKADGARGKKMIKTDFPLFQDLNVKEYGTPPESGNRSVNPLL